MPAHRHIFFKHSLRSQVKPILLAGEGGYNISVMIFPVEDGNQFDVSAPQIASLDYLFYAEALPKVRFDQALYVAMPRQPIRFVLVQTKADQQLTIRWVMGDGKVYPDAGMSFHDKAYVLAMRKNIFPSSTHPHILCCHRLLSAVEKYIRSYLCWFGLVKVFKQCHPVGADSSNAFYVPAMKLSSLRLCSLLRNLQVVPLWCRNHVLRNCPFVFSCLNMLRHTDHFRKNIVFMLVYCFARLFNFVFPKPTSRKEQIFRKLLCVSCFQLVHKILFEVAIKVYSQEAQKSTVVVTEPEKFLYLNNRVQPSRAGPNTLGNKFQIANCEIRVWFKNSLKKKATKIKHTRKL